MKTMGGESDENNLHLAIVLRSMNELRTTDE